MKYFNIPCLQTSIERIIYGGVIQEHRTGTAALGLVRHYFPINKFAITPEQIQQISNKRPDLTIEKYTPISQTFSLHTFIELKSLVNSNIPNIVGQLFDAIHETLDYHGGIDGNYSCFIIAMKGTKIAFYMYHNFASLLHDHNIENFNGFIPLTYLIPDQALLDINGPSLLNIIYRGGITFNTDPNTLTQLGVEGTNDIPHPHVFDLLNARHREDIHKIFTYIAEKDANLMFVD